MPMARAVFPCLATLACMMASLANAQSVTSGSGADRGWRWTPSISVSEEFDNNVFLLPDGKRDNLGAAGSSELQSGRYVEMASASDIVTQLRGAVALERRGLGGKTMTVTPELGYDLYSRNGELSSARMAVTLAQKLRRGGQARVRASLAPRAFVKNYLVDALDRDGDGSIAADERLYAPAQQGSRRISADYTHRLDKSSRTNPFGAALRVGAGWYARSNDAPFASRDLSGPTLDLSLLLQLTAETRVRVGYDLEALSAPRMESVVLLDEAQFDEDFNGNLSRDDIDVRAVRMIDRSRTEHELGVAVEQELSRRVDGQFSIVRRTRAFGSAERYDVANNGRRDARNEMEGELRFRVTSPLRVRMSASYASQSLNRASATASTGDVADYSRVRGSVGLTYRY